MTNRTHASPLALTAIAAVLALAPTPVLAQEAAAPDPAPVTAPAPAAATIDSPAPIIIPELRSAPVVQAVPETPAVVVPTPAITSAARAAPRQTARPARTTAVVPAAAAIAPTNVAPVTAAETIAIAVPADVPVVTAAEPAAPLAALAQNDNTALGLGLLGLVALGGAGAYGLARRRRRVTEPAVAYREEHLAAPAPIVTPTVTMATSAWTPAVAAANERHPIAATSASSAIPAGPLPTGPALVNLFEGMATAAPDADNPYTSVKRRRQRVRWLMKQHEYALRDGAADRFDFRNYQSNAKPSENMVQTREVVPA